MKSFSSANPAWIKVMRWTARIISLLFVLLTLFFFIAEGIYSDHSKTASTPIVSLVLGALLIIGLCLAWKWEFLGALISLVGFIGISIVNPNALMKPLWYVFLLTAILFLRCWWLSRLPGRPKVM